MTYFVANTSTPTETTGQITVDWMNSNIKVAGRTNYGEWTVTVRDSITHDSFKYFTYWKSLVYDRTTGYSSIPKDYKFPIDLQLLQHNGDVTRSFRMVNCFPTAVAAVNLDYTAEGIFLFGVTFQLDMFIEF